MAVSRYIVSYNLRKEKEIMICDKMVCMISMHLFPDITSGFVIDISEIRTLHRLRLITWILNCKTYLFWTFPKMHSSYLRSLDQITSKERLLLNSV